MATHRLDNYLRAYRRRAGLTQDEVAVLLGFENGAQVSRYEKQHRLPPLRMALACEAIFGVPVSELFAGIRDSASKGITRRLQRLTQQLQQKAVKGSELVAREKKLRWITERQTTPCKT